MAVKKEGQCSYGCVCLLFLGMFLPLSGGAMTVLLLCVREMFVTCRNVCLFSKRNVLCFLVLRGCS